MSTHPAPQPTPLPVVVDQLTKERLREAGIGVGMRVLDVGCGVGDLSLVTAELVGPKGRVIGVDRSHQAIRTAALQAAAAGRSNLFFTRRELAELQLDEPLDAVVGRLAAMQPADLQAAVRQLASWLKPGGPMVFEAPATP